MKFDDEAADLNHQAKLVAEHRKANPHIYSPGVVAHFDHALIQQEIIVQVCARNPSVCEDSARPGQPYPYTPPPGQPAAAAPDIYRQEGKKCVRCQFTEFTPIYCQTCGGNRVTGYKCLKCGLDN